MKRNLSLLLLILFCMASSGCGIFKRGCGCPKVVYINVLQKMNDKKS